LASEAPKIGVLYSEASASIDPAYLDIQLAVCGCSGFDRSFALEDATGIHDVTAVEVNMREIQSHHPKLCHTLLNGLKAIIHAIQSHAS
jgi:hypothetical protein